MTISEQTVTSRRKIVKCPICKKFVVAYGDLFFKHCGEAHLVEKNNANKKESDELNNETKRNKNGNRKKI